MIANRNKGIAFHAEGAGSLTEVSYRLGSRKGPEKFVRVEVVDEHGGAAWTNPFFLESDYYPTNGAVRGTLSSGV